MTELADKAAAFELDRRYIAIGFRVASLAGLPGLHRRRRLWHPDATPETVQKIPQVARARFCGELVCLLGWQGDIDRACFVWRAGSDRDAVLAAAHNLHRSQDALWRIARRCGITP